MAPRLTGVAGGRFLSKSSGDSGGAKLTLRRRAGSSCCGAAVTVTAGAAALLCGDKNCVTAPMRDDTMLRGVKALASGVPDADLTGVFYVEACPGKQWRGTRKREETN